MLSITRRLFINLDGCLSSQAHLGYQLEWTMCVLFIYFYYRCIVVIARPCRLFSPLKTTCLCVCFVPFFWFKMAVWVWIEKIWRCVFLIYFVNINFSGPNCFHSSNDIYIGIHFLHMLSECISSSSVYVQQYYYRKVLRLHNWAVRTAWSWWFFGCNLCTPS
jgi:hypothetical protein